MRLLCALFVIVSHSFALLNRILDEPLCHLGGMMNAADIGLCGFFTISGYLILNSVVTSKNIFSYLGKRCLRIFPGLLVCLIVVMVVCSFFYTGEGSYWAQKETYSFVWNNLGLYTMQGDIPGVFTDNPYTTGVDGSLWTLAYEFTLYLLIIGLFFVRKHPPVIAGFTAVALVLCLTKNIFFAEKFAHTQYHSIWVNLFVPFAQYFAMGMLLQNRTYFRSDKARWVIVGICAAVAICLVVTNMYIQPRVPLKPLVMICISILFILVGEMYWQPVSDGIKRTGDMSYGTYIYAFPIQQMLISLMPGINPWCLTVVTIMVVLPIAFGSWRLIEKPSLGLKRFL